MKRDLFASRRVSFGVVASKLRHVTLPVALVESKPALISLLFLLVIFANDCSTLNGMEEVDGSNPSRSTKTFHTVSVEESRRLSGVESTWSLGADCCEARERWRNSQSAYHRGDHIRRDGSQVCEMLSDVAELGGHKSFRYATNRFVRGLEAQASSQFHAARLVLLRRRYAAER